jgi:hypothetical protein
MADGRQGYPSFVDQVALGLVPGFRTLRKFGDNEAVPGGGTTTDIWPATQAGVSRRVLPTSAAVVSVTSTSIEDDPDKGGAVPGTGAHIMRVEGLGADFVEIYEDVTLNGTAAVTTTLEFLRINRMYSVFCGTSEYNQGDLLASIGGNVQAVIEALEGQTHQAMYTVPAGHTLLVTDLEFSVGRMASSADLHAFGEAKLFGTNAWRIIENVYMATGSNFDTHRPVVAFPEKTELRASAHADAVTQMSGMFGGYLAKNSILATM